MLTQWAGCAAQDVGGHTKLGEAELGGRAKHEGAAWHTSSRENEPGGKDGRGRCARRKGEERHKQGRCADVRGRGEEGARSASHEGGHPRSGRKAYEHLDTTGRVVEDK
jgi:hypothetical protein